MLPRQRRRTAQGTRPSQVRCIEQACGHECGCVCGCGCVCSCVVCRRVAADASRVGAYSIFDMHNWPWDGTGTRLLSSSPSFALSLAGFSPAFSFLAWIKACHVTRLHLTALPESLVRRISPALCRIVCRIVCRISPTVRLSHLSPRRPPCWSIYCERTIASCTRRRLKIPVDLRAATASACTPSSTAAASAHLLTFSLH